MNMAYWSFGDFIKSTSFRTINTLDISNTDLAKSKNESTQNSYSFIMQILQNFMQIHAKFAKT